MHGSICADFPLGLSLLDAVSVMVRLIVSLDYGYILR